MGARDVMHFTVPTIKQRGQLAQLTAQVQQHRPPNGESTGYLRCTCGSRLRYTVASTGVSRAQCVAGCGVRWQQ